MNGGSIRDKIRAQLKEFEAEIDRLDERSKQFDEALKRKFAVKAEEFRKFIDESDVNVDRIRELSREELDKLGSTLAFTGKALKKSFNHFVAQFDERDRNGHDKAA